MNCSRQIVATLVLALCGSAQAHVGTRIFPVYELPPGYIDLRDGTIADWEDLAPEASLTMLDFQTLNVSDGASINPEDLSYRVFVGWSLSEQRVYFAVERFDDTYINEYDGSGVGSIWRHDNVEFYLDGDHSGELYNRFSTDAFSGEEIKLMTNFQAQQYVAVAASPDDRLFVGFNAGDVWVSQPPWAEAGGWVSEGAPYYSLVELAATPWDELNWKGPGQSRRSELRAGSIIGFGLSLVDFDSRPGQYHGWHMLAENADSWFDAGALADGLLLCGTEACGGGEEVSAVAVDSWGRIKAGFMR